ncbi:hypothetical protein [Deinococcus hohokamensis]|uniref:Uncharacterized protein n=1 Tax=Deinococcus hohokamensis TaxID=309883 RepID=A0ABV9I7H5_9DEIO
MTTCPLARPLSALLALALLAPAAAGAPAVPAALSGEWYAGTVYPRSVYTPGSGNFTEAASTARRLVLRPDGTYELTRLERGASVGYFGARMISCEQISVHWEQGTFKVAGSTLSLKPAASRGVNAATPSRVNSGCTRFAGLRYDGRDLALRPYTWKVTGQTLALGARDASQTYRRATPEEIAHANTPVAPAPSPVAQPTRTAPAPVRAGATGAWTGRFVTQGGAPLDVLLNLDDDRNGVAGMVYTPEERYIGTAHGHSGTGTLTLTIHLPDDSSVELRAEGTFDGDRYTGRFQAFAGDQALGAGTVSLIRQPAPTPRR